MYFLFVETRRASLEETAAIMDGTALREQFIEGVARATEQDGKVPINEKVGDRRAVREELIHVAR